MRAGRRTSAGILVAGLLALVGVSSGAPGQPAAAATGPTVTVATYNLCKRTCGSDRFDWRIRRHAVVRNIVASGADVVAVQEAAGTVRGLARRLAPHGYALANRATDGCGHGCTQDSFIFYRTDAMSLLGVRHRQGTARLSTVSRVRWSGTYDRGWSWAYLRDRASGAAVLVASVHLPSDKTGWGERLRRSSARGLVQHLADNRRVHGLPGLATVIAGDLNSFAERQPRGAQHILSRAGYQDAFTAPRRTNARVATINVTRRHRDPFPARPVRSDTPARLDYVLVAGGRPIAYEVFLRLKRGRFDNRYRGSDHNLVLGSVQLPG